MKNLWMYTYLGIIEIQNINNMQHITLWNTLFPPNIPSFLGSTLLTLPKAKWKSQLLFNPITYLSYKFTFYTQSKNLIASSY